MAAKQPLKPDAAERRRAEREVLVHPPKGKLQLYTRLQRYDVVEIRDVSPFGLGLRLNAVIDDKSPVRVMYVHRGLQLDLSGSVAWLKPARQSGSNGGAGHGCWVGVFLHPDNLDANFILYQSLKGDAD